MSVDETPPSCLYPDAGQVAVPGGEQGVYDKGVVVVMLDETLVPMEYLDPEV